MPILALLKQDIIAWLDSIDKQSVTKEEIFDWLDSDDESSVSKEHITQWITYAGGDEDLNLIDGFEDAFIGLIWFPGDQKMRAVYDEDQCTEVVMRDAEIEDPHEAADACSYSTIRALAREKDSPGFLIPY